MLFNCSLNKKLYSDLKKSTRGSFSNIFIALKILLITPITTAKRLIDFLKGDNYY